MCSVANRDALERFARLSDRPLKYNGLLLRTSLLVPASTSSLHHHPLHLHRSQSNLVHTMSALKAPQPTEKTPRTRGVSAMVCITDSPYPYPHPSAHETLRCMPRHHLTLLSLWSQSTQWANSLICSAHSDLPANSISRARPQASRPRTCAMSLTGS